MSLAAEFADQLKLYQHSHPQLTAWRFDLYEMAGQEIGLKNNKLGGPYSAPSYKSSISGEVYLIWSRQRFTVAKLDAQAVAEFDAYMKLWEKTAYYDPDGVELYNPKQLPEPVLVDPKVSEAVAGNFETGFQLLNDGLQRLLEDGLNKIDGKFKCFQVRRHLMNSAGFKLEYDQTPLEFFFEGNDSYGEGYQEKKWPDPAEVERIISNTGTITKLLARDYQTSLSGPIKLLMPPGTADSFLNHFLMTNLSGSLTVNNQSRFSLSDFQNGLQVLHPKLSLSINNLMPWRAFSYPCTAEGVPGGAIDLIAKGRLQTPIFNLKYAKKAGMAPTPLPLGGRGFFLTSTEAIPAWDDLVKGTERGLIVYSVLGLHTQDASSGRFSLTADQCLLVEQGEIKGKVKAVINGDFLGALAAEETELAKVVGEDNPGVGVYG